MTCVPSLRHPDLVPDFARRLAAALSLPFHAVLEKTDDRPEQKTMANSTQQARNVDGSLASPSWAVPAWPVLLVDDMVDSRWTFTVAAWLLRSHGSGEVFPLALARGTRTMTMVAFTQHAGHPAADGAPDCGPREPSSDLLTPGEYKRLARAPSRPQTAAR